MTGEVILAQFFMHFSVFMTVFDNIFCHVSTSMSLVQTAKFLTATKYKIIHYSSLNVIVESRLCKKKKESTMVVLCPMKILLFICLFKNFVSLLVCFLSFYEVRAE